MSQQDNSAKEWRDVVPVLFSIDEVQRRSGRWTSPDWELASLEVMPDSKPEPFSVDIVAGSDGAVRTHWRGFALRLYKDAGESYWANLMSGKPRIFVICEIDEESDSHIQPQLLTASQDEANAHLETDSFVLSVEMPFELADNLERFVVDTYVPEQKRKRKRVEGDALGSKP